MNKSKFNRFLVLFVGLLTMCVTQVWAESWSWTPSATSDLGTASATTEQSITLNEKAWKSKFNQSRASFQSTQQALQIGANGSVANGYLKTNAFDGYTITCVTVNCASYNNAHKVAISIGGEVVKGATATSKWTTMGDITTGTISKTGEIEITVSEGSRAFYLSTITITYEAGASNNPSITKSGTLSDFTATYGSPSAEQSFTVGGSNLTANISVSAPTNYEISKTSGSGFASSVTLTKDGSGNVANTTLYVRLKNNVDAGSVAEAKITCSSDGATNQTISIPASKVQSKVNWSVNGSAAAGSPTGAVDKSGKVTTLPTAPTSSDCDGSKVFVGWTDAPIASPTNTKPSTLFTAASGAPAINVNEVTYYAVFATQAGGSSSLSYGWEGTMSSTDWEKNSLSDGSSYNTYKHTGSYAGSTGSATTAYIKTKNKIASPTSATCYYTKASSNTNNTSKFIIQVSTNGTSWTDVSTGKTMDKVTQGTFEELTADLSSYSNVYVRFYYTGTSATRVLDDVSVSYGSYTYSNYTTTCGPATYTASIVAPVNGSIKLSKDGENWGTAALEGLKSSDEFYFQVTPDDGYEIETLTVTDGEDKTYVINDDYEWNEEKNAYYMLVEDADVVISATFQPIPACTITPTIVLNGAVSKTTADADFTPDMVTEDVGSEQTITFASSNPEVATIVDNKVHIVGVGTSNITASVEENGDYCSVVSDICVLTVTKPSHNAYFYVNSTLQNEGGTSYEEDATITFPDVLADLYGMKFQGWTKTSDYTNATDAPADLCKSATMATTDVNYYAVFAEEEGGVKWVKTETSASLISGTYILIASDGKAFNGSISSGDGGVTETAFSFNGEGVATSAPAGACEFTLESTTENQYKLKNKADNKYLYASAAKSGSLAWQNSESNYWSFASSQFQYKTAGSSSYTAQLRFYNDKLKSYATSTTNGSVVAFAKKVDNTVSKNYSTTVVEPTYTLSVGDHANGTIKLSTTDDNWSEAGTELLEGLYAEDAVYFQVIANDGYELNTLALTKGKGGNMILNTDYVVWDTDDQSYAIASMPTDNVTISATFTAITHSVTLNTNGGMINAGNIAEYAEPTGATLPTDVTKIGHDFGGWFDNEDLNGDAVTTIPVLTTGDKAYWANWTPSVYNVSYELNGGSWNGAEGTASYTYGVGLTLPTNVEKTNNTFDGWFLNNEGDAVSAIAADAIGDKSFTAHWTPLTTRTIVYNGIESGITITDKPLSFDGLNTSLVLNYILAEHYQINGVTIKVGETTLTESEVVLDKEAKTVTITPNAGSFDDDLTITFDVETIKISVTWKVNGEDYTAGDPTGEVVEGSAITTLPTEPNSCDLSVVFMGWTDAAFGKQQTAPANLYKQASDFPALTAAAEYHAVWATEIESGEAAPAATVMTSNTNPAEGDNWAAANTSGTSNYSAITTSVYGTTGIDVIKLGVGSNGGKGGTGYVFVPAGTATLTLHAVAWTGKENVTLAVSAPDGVTVSPADAQTLTANSGATGTTPTVTAVDGKDFYYTFTLSGVTEKTKITLTAANERALIWGINASGTTTDYRDYTTTCEAASPTYNLTLNQTTGGTISASKIAKIAEDETVKLSYVETSGYTFSSWTVKDESENAVSVNAENEFRMPASNVTAEATFAPNRVTGVTMDATASVEENKTITLTATIAPANALDQEIVWTSSNANATVEGGVVTGVTPGTAVIRATAHDNSEIYAECTVTITEAPKIVTWDLTTDSYASASEQSVSWTSNFATMTLDKGNSNIKANNYLSPYLRTYAGQTLTITPASGFAIERIELNAYSNDKAVAAKGGTWTNATASMETGSDVKLVTVTPTNGETAVVLATATYLNSVSVYYSIVPTRTLKSIAVSGDAHTTTFWKGEDFNTTDLVVMASYEEDGVADRNVTSLATITAPEPWGTIADGQTVNISYTENGVTKETNYTIDIKTIANLPTNPYTTTEAVALIAAGKDLLTPVYVSGEVTTKTVDTEWKNANITIKDPADASKTIQGYRMRNLNNTDFTDASQILVGDNVVLYGLLYKYNSSNQIVADNGKTVGYVYSRETPIIDVTEVTVQATASVRAGKTVDISGSVVVTPANATNKAVTYTVTSGSEYAEVSAAGVVTGKLGGEAVITVTSVADGTKYATCTVTVLPAPNFAGGTWEIVKSASELKVNDYVIIAAAGSDYAMAQYVAEANNCGLKSITKSTDKESIAFTAENTPAIFQVCNGYLVNGNPTGIAFYDFDTEKYIYAPTGDKNYLKAQTILNNAASWSVSINASYEATIVSYCATANKTIKYNSSSSIFSCYTTGQAAVSLYKYYAPCFKVTYELNGGEVETEIVDGRTDADNKVTITSTIPTKAGYQFAGWKDAADNLYNAGEEYTFTESTTLTAQWAENAKYRVTYVAGGGEGEAPEAELVSYGLKYTVKANDWFYQNGYTFDGWKLNTTSYAAGATLTMPENDIEFVAQWKELEIEGDPVVIVAKYGDKYYAMGHTLNSNALNAVEVIVKNNMIMEVAPANRDAITWYKHETEDGTTFQMSSGQYLATGSGNTDLALNNSSFPAYWTNTADGYYERTSGRSFFYQASGNYFKNFQVSSNAGKSGYSNVAFFITTFSDAEKYTRSATDFAKGTVTTICLPKAVEENMFEGCSIYEVAYKTVDANGDPYKVFFDQVFSMEAGHPYVIELEEGASEAVFYMSGESAPAATVNGLVGTFEAIAKAENNILNAYGDEDEAKYIVYQNQIRKCGHNCSLGANKAYIDVNAIEPENASNATPAPGRRRISLGNPAAAPGSATGVENAGADVENIQKVFINGYIYILRGEHIYDATGRLVK